MNNSALGKFCKEYGFSVPLLKKITICRVRGYNNSDCAKKLGVNRVTVQRYVDGFKQADHETMHSIALEIFRGKDTASLMKEIQR